MDENVFVSAFHAGQIDIMEQILNKKNKLSMSKSTFSGLWKQEITLGRDKNNVKLLQSVCSCDIEDSKALKVIAEKLLKGLCFSKIGLITCCKRCRTSNGDKNEDVSETVPTDKTLQVAVLLNQKKKAATLWHRSENPMREIVTLNNFQTDIKWPMGLTTFHYIPMYPSCVILILFKEASSSCVLTCFSSSVETVSDCCIFRKERQTLYLFLHLFFPMKRC